MGNILNTTLINEQSNVIVSGWQVYDNKGKVVEKYEPFFSTGWNYLSQGDALCGQKVTTFYDPRGQPIRIVNPDTSEQIVIYGVPGSIALPELENPKVFEPTPWESYTYDANDNAGRTHKDTSSRFQNHWNTPSSIENDALGRKTKITGRNGTTNGLSDNYVTKFVYDIRGNPLNVIDPLDRVAFSYIYDLARKPNILRTEHLDAGIHVAVSDVTSNILEKRDSKGSLILNAFDKLNRPTHLWARDNINEIITLREVSIYGDDEAGSYLNHDQAKQLNLLGKIYKKYDESGLIGFIPDPSVTGSRPYDFKGNVLEKVRGVIRDDVILNMFDIPSSALDNLRLQALPGRLAVV